MLGQFIVHGLQADRVRDVPHGQTGLVQDGDDALVRLLHQVHDDLVVEVVDLSGQQRRPDSFGTTPNDHSLCVLFLTCCQVIPSLWYSSCS